MPLFSRGDGGRGRGCRTVLWLTFRIKNDVPNLLVKVFFSKSNILQEKCEKQKRGRHDYFSGKGASYDKNEYKYNLSFKNEVLNTHSLSNFFEKSCFRKKNRKNLLNGAQSFFRDMVHLTTKANITLKTNTFWILFVNFFV